MPAKARGGIEKKGGGYRVKMYWKNQRKHIIGPMRHGSNAEADAERDRQILCEARTSMANLEAVASELKAAAAAARTYVAVETESRKEKILAARAWRLKQRR